MSGSKYRRSLAVAFALVLLSGAFFDLASVLLLIPAYADSEPSAMLRSLSVVGRCSHQGGFGADHCAPVQPVAMRDDHGCCAIDEPAAPAEPSCHGPAVSEPAPIPNGCQIVPRGCTCAAHSQPIGLIMASASFRCLEPVESVSFDFAAAVLSINSDSKSIRNASTKPPTPPPELLLFA